jgi:hypothetical protein
VAVLRSLRRAKATCDQGRYGGSHDADTPVGVPQVYDYAVVSFVGLDAVMPLYRLNA